MTNKKFLIAILCLILMTSLPAQNFRLSERKKFKPDLFYDYSFFRGPGKKVKVRLYIQSNYDLLQFVKEDGEYEARFKVTLGIYDGDEIVHMKELSDTIVTEDYNQTVKSLGSKVLQDEVDLKPGKYKIILKLRDLNSQQECKEKSSLEVPQLGDDLRMSSIRFLARDKKSKKFKPLITEKYSIKDSVIVIYFEIYPQDRDTTNEIQYKIVDGDGETFLNERDTITDNFEIRRELEPKDLEAGDYTLKVTYKNYDLTKDVGFMIPWKAINQVKEDFDKTLDQLKYIAEAKKLKDLKEAETREEKVRNWKEFWKDRDPTPSTDINEAKQEFYRRVNYANENFSGIRPGWKTDRGKIYIIYGAPDEVERHPFEMDSYPYVTWYYFSINKKFIFVDKNRTNDYELYYEE